MVKFKSIVVLDTETTSLPENDHNTTRISELAVLGCEVDHLKPYQGLPRVLHKLVLLFNPEKKIDPGATNVTGLSNELLMNLNPFTVKDAEALRHFIERLPSPVCILAHGGKKFDFPILRRALEKLEKNLPNNIYCADTIEAFRDLLPAAENSLRTKRTFSSTINKTPEHQKTQQKNVLHYKPQAVKRLFVDDPITSPEDPGLCLDDPTVTPESSRLFPNDRELSIWASSQNSSDAIDQRFRPRPKTYSLKDVYYFFFERYFTDSHRAEEDSKALLCCVIMCFEKFSDWLIKNAVVFNSIAPLF